MIRKIQCLTCFRSIELLPTPAEDVANGWKRRVVSLTVTNELRCDLCGAKIPDNTEARAVTNWNVNREGEPLAWEEDYGRVS